MNDFIFPTTATHLKTGNVYTVTGVRIDATNSTSDRLMVEYESEHGKYIRDAIEFLDKFTLEGGILTPLRLGKTERMLAAVEEFAKTTPPKTRAKILVIVPLAILPYVENRLSPYRDIVMVRARGDIGNFSFESFKSTGRTYAKVFIDHHVIEDKFSRLLEELHRYD